MWTDISCTTMVVKLYPPHGQQMWKISLVQRWLSNIIPHMFNNVKESIPYNDDCQTLPPTWSKMWTYLSCTTTNIVPHMVKNVNISFLYNEGCQTFPPLGQQCEQISPVQRWLSIIIPSHGQQCEQISPVQRWLSNIVGSPHCQKCEQLMNPLSPPIYEYNRLMKIL